jgi:prevent-host-death family protein
MVIEVSMLEFRTRLTELIAKAKDGDEIVIRDESGPVARLIPGLVVRKNKSKPGGSVGKGKILGDLAEPLIPMESWEMFK